MNNLGPIPGNLLIFDWYAPHQAWLREQGEPHHDPGNAEAARADLTGSPFSTPLDTALSLRGAVLCGCKGVATKEESIARLDEIRKHVIEYGDELDMCHWHGNEWNPELPVGHACETSHCLGGWSQALCDDPAIRLMGTLEAGVRLIPIAVGRFWDSDEETLRWLENREYAN